MKLRFAKPVGHWATRHIHSVCVWLGEDTPTGRVTFYFRYGYANKSGEIGGTNYTGRPATLIGGQASFKSTVHMSKNPAYIYAIYSGDSNYDSNYSNVAPSDPIGGRQRLEAEGAPLLTFSGMSEAFLHSFAETKKGQVESSLCVPMSTAASPRSNRVLPSSLAVCTHRGGVEIVDQLADEWRALCSESADDQIFYRPEFIRAHICAKIPAAKLVIITVRRRGRLRFLLPLVEERSTFSKIPVRRLREPADLNCGRFDGIRSAGAGGEAAVLAAWRHLREMPGWDLLQLRFSLAGSTVGRLASAAEAEGFLTIHESDRPNPYVPVPTDLALLESMPPNAKLRSQLRQIRRKIAEQGTLKVHCVEKAEPAVLDRIFALEASGWKGQAGTAVNDQPEVRQFLNQLAWSAANSGHLCLYMLDFNDELIAAHFSLLYRDRCHSPIVAFNEKFRHFAPGHLIVSEILRDCVRRGITGFDITGQDQAWKMKWTDQALAITHHYVFRGPIGHLAYGAGFRLKPGLRRVLPRLTRQ